MKEVFFIIGAQRSGTTYLTHFLDAHPDVEMAKPLVPEPKFFLSETEFNKGKIYYLNKFFPNEKARVLGEKSTSYLESDLAGQRIKLMFPDAKIIVVLRNPVQRAISNYFFSKLNGIETRDIREVFRDKKSIDIDLKSFSVSPIDYLQRGEYLKYLSRYEELFSKDSMKVLIFERMISEESYLNSLLEFLNIAPFSKVPDIVNKNSSLYPEKIEMDIIKELQSYYSHHIDELENRYQMDLSIWKK